MGFSIGNTLRGFWMEKFRETMEWWIVAMLIGAVFCATVAGLIIAIIETTNIRSVTGSIEFSSKTGLIEMIGWSFGLLFAAIGLTLAGFRTHEMWRANNTAEKNIEISRKSLETATKSLENSTKAHEHDQEIELRKQFRQAASDLDPMNFSKTKHALVEFERIAKFNCQQFARPAVDILLAFIGSVAKEPERNPRADRAKTAAEPGTVAAAIATLGNIVDTEGFNRGQTANAKVRITGAIILDKLENAKISNIVFENCQFREQIKACIIHDSYFFNCTVAAAEPAFEFCNLTRAEWRKSNYAEGEKPPSFENCNMTLFAVHFTQYQAKRPNCDIEMVRCNLTDFRVRGEYTGKPFVEGCWYFKNKPRHLSKFLPDIKPHDFFYAPEHSFYFSHKVSGEMYEFNFGDPNYG